MIIEPTVYGNLHITVVQPTMNQLAIAAAPLVQLEQAPARCLILDCQIRSVHVNFALLDFRAEPVKDLRQVASAIAELQDMAAEVVHA